MDMKTDTDWKSLNTLGQAAEASKMASERLTFSSLGSTVCYMSCLLTLVNVIGINAITDNCEGLNFCFFLYFLQSSIFSDGGNKEGSFK